MKNLWIQTVGMVFGVALLGAAPVWAHEEGEASDDGHLIPHAVDGLSVEGGVTWFLQGTDGLVTGNGADLTYTLDLGLETELGGVGTLFVAFEAGDGNGVDNRVGSLSTANYDAFITELSAGINAPSISQLYVESELAGGLLTVDFGKMDIHSLYDDNAYANDETDQFMSGIFTRSAGTSYGELDGYYAPALALTLGFSDMADLMAAVANGNSSGFDGVGDRPYVVTQLALHPAVGGLEGNYRFYYIYDDRYYLDNSAAPGAGVQTESTAFGVSLDQALAENVGLFARYSTQDDSVQDILPFDPATGVYGPAEAANMVKGAWSAGAQLGGGMWGRGDDAVGIGYGVVQVNDKNANWAFTPDDESHLEVYYKLGLSDHMTLTADIQQVGNNGGDPAADTITVYGVRGQINF